MARTVATPANRYIWWRFCFPARGKWGTPREAAMLMQYSDPIDAGPGLAPDARTWSRRAGSVMVMFTLMLPFVLVPMVGLAIDGTMMYSVKAKLQAAVDGGAIAAAQTLNSGMTFAVQKATAEKTARQFIRANIVVGGTGSSGYWGAYN